MKEPAVPEVAGPADKQPSDPAREGELLRLGLRPPLARRRSGCGRHCSAPALTGSDAGRSAGILRAARTPVTPGGAILMES